MRMNLKLSFPGRRRLWEAVLSPPLGFTRPPPGRAGPAGDRSQPGRRTAPLACGRVWGRQVRGVLTLLTWIPKAGPQASVIPVSSAWPSLWQSSQALCQARGGACALGCDLGTLCLCCTWKMCSNASRLSQGPWGAGFCPIKTWVYPFSTAIFPCGRLHRHLLSLLEVPTCTKAHSPAGPSIRVAGNCLCNPAAHPARAEAGSWDRLATVRLSGVHFAQQVASGGSLQVVPRQA